LLAENATARLSVLSESAFQVVVVWDSVLYTITFEKKLSTVDRIRPFLNW
jgi:hypothetical protein